MDYISLQDIMLNTTWPSSDSEAETLFKLKGPSLNMRTGQGLKKRVLNPSSWFVQLVCPTGLSSWSVQLVRPAGPSSWSVQLVRPAGPSCWSIKLVHPAGPSCWSIQLICLFDQSNLADFSRSHVLQILHDANCMCCK